MIYKRVLKLKSSYVGVRGSTCTDILMVAKALALSELMAIFYPGDGKS